MLGTQLRDAFDLNNTEIGFLYGSIFSLFYAFSGIPMGRLADHISRKWMIVFGVIIWSLATVLSGFANGFFLLILYRIIVALAESASSPAAYSLICDYVSPAHRGTAISLYASGIFLGIGLSFLTGGYVANQFSWEYAFVAVGLPGIVIGVIASWVIKDIPHQTKNVNYVVPSISDTLKLLWKIAAVRWHLIGFAALAFSGYSLLGFISYIFVDVHKSSWLIPHYGWFMFGTGVTVALSGLLADHLAKKHAKYRFICGMIAAVGGLPFYIMGLLAADGLTALLLIGTGALVASSYNGVAAAIIQDLVPVSMRAFSGGVYLFVISIVGLGTGPLITGILTDLIFTGENGIIYSLILVMTFAGLIGFGALFKAMNHYPD